MTKVPKAKTLKRKMTCLPCKEQRKVVSIIHNGWETIKCSVCGFVIGRYRVS